MIQQSHFCEYIQRNKNTNLKRNLHFHVHTSIIHNSQSWKQPKCSSVDKQTDYGLSI